MKLRCELHLGDRSAKYVLAARPEEKLDHLAMKLAALAMFLDRDPVVEPSPDHPALQGYEVRPDVMALDPTGKVALWIECGEVSISKLDKVARRMNEGRLIVIKAQRPQAQRLRAVVTDEVRQPQRVEIWTWPEGAFADWMGALLEKTELYGEAHERSFNLVINDRPYAVDLLSY